MFTKLKKRIIKGFELIGSHFEGRIDSDEAEDESLH